MKIIKNPLFWSGTKNQVSSKLAHEKALDSVIGESDDHEHTSNSTVILAWTAVGIPLAWGVYKTFLSALNLFA